MTTVSTSSSERISLETLRAMREAKTPIAMLTCYDFPTAQILDAAGIPMLLVGDSAANTVLGLSSTREIPPEFLVTITAAVRRGAKRAFVLADLPFRASSDAATAVATAERFIHETGADAVKVEVTGDDLPLLRAMVAAKIPVCAHLGLLPQRVTTPDGFRARGRTREEAATIVRDAVACASLGIPLMLLEAVPDEVTREIVSKTSIPVIGCGAGPSAHGHVIVLHDVLGFNSRPPRFAEVFANLPETLAAAAKRYLDAVTSRAYPGEKHQYHMKSE